MRPANCSASAAITVSSVMHTLTITAGPTGAPNPVAPGYGVALTATATEHAARVSPYRRAIGNGQRGAGGKRRAHRGTHGSTPSRVTTARCNLASNESLVVPIAR